jgi:hypothetical protein
MKDKIYEQEKLSKGVANSSFYRRLKMVMDYWCALWFWPITEAEMLPTRLEFLNEVGMILGEMEMVVPAQAEQLLLFPETQEPKQGQLSLKTWGFVDLEQLKLFCPRLQIVEELSTRHRFFHWELEFADLFLEQDGFDLMVGNPPWLKVEWSEGILLGDYDPIPVIRKFSAPECSEEWKKLFKSRPQLQSGYLAEYEEAAGTQNFLNAVQNYPLLQGSKVNLFKCFLPQAWEFCKDSGVSGFLHPEGVYDDQKGKLLRREIYQRLSYHFQFENEKILFPIGGTRRYGINIYKKGNYVNFVLISNIFHPKTINECFEHHGSGDVGGIKDEENNWNLDGHQKRLINVNLDRLKLFAQLYDAPNTAPIEACLPSLHAESLVSVLEKFSKQPKQLGDLHGVYYPTVCFSETKTQKDGTIRRDTSFPETPHDLILSGPHFYVGLPLYKTPRTICTEKGHYDVLDLTILPDDYLPRTNYRPDCSPTEYLARIPRVIWNDEPFTNFYRLVFSRQLSQLGERTLQPAIVPKFSAHIHPVISLTLEDTA